MVQRDNSVHFHLGSVTLLVCRSYWYDALLTIDIRNVGPFRYWTLSNVPLFLLAAPALWLLTFSAVEFMRNPRMFLPSSTKVTSETVLLRDRVTALSLALPQFLLAILALLSYHVQIITRLASGYPLWYIWLAYQTVEGGARTSTIIRWMVIYGLVQAGLYASFLPPA
jgi:phosphatidylinositol glycan class V